MSNIASAAILASALKPSQPQSDTGTETISESIAKRPIQWLIVGAAIIYFGSKVFKAIGEGKNTETAETSSTGNPWAFNNFLDWSKVPKGTNILQYDDAVAKARQIYNALDVIAYENEDIVVGVFTSLPSKLQVAQVAKVFYDWYGKDILTYMQQGNKTLSFFTGGLSEQNYNRIIENVNRKPKF